MTTTLALLQLDLAVPQANSLKDKRRIVKGFKDRLAHRFNVSVAEVDGLDTHRRAALAIAMVGNDRRYVESKIQKICNAATQHRDMMVIEQNIEWL
ncbi:MAG: DUF503 family protein [Planctomycetes bacterium]|jgi:uncharacterized protein YlxP (DUF503 family)|nr:DUF503 family protein [Planctomycetota bacterium]